MLSERKYVWHYKILLFPEIQRCNFYLDGGIRDKVIPFLSVHSNTYILHYLNSTCI